MGDINDLMRKLDMIAMKVSKVNFEEVTPDELDSKLNLPRAPLQSASPKLHATREEAEKRANNKEYDEAQNEAEQKAEQLKKWLVD